MFRTTALLLLALSMNVCLGASSSAMESILALDPSFASKPEYLKTSDRASLTLAFEFATSRVARDAFTKIIDLNWDSDLEPSKKKTILSLAEESAKKASEEIIRTYTNGKRSNGKPWTLSAIVAKEISSHPANDIWWEKHLFIKDGAVNYKSAEFTGEPKSELAADPLVWADSQFKGTPKMREERRQRLAAEQADELRRLQAASCIACSTATHNSPISCGDPSGQVGALRPETNGSR
jgi:hypothetical protein